MNEPQINRRSDYHGQKYPGVDRRHPEPTGWHLDKKVPLAFIFALLVQTVMIVIAFQDLKRDTALNTAQIETLKGENTKIYADSKDDRAIVREQYRTLNEKLDRLIERNGK